MSTSRDLPNLSRPDLEALLVELFGQVAELKALVAAQRDEIARLKGLKGRPSIKPSGMEQSTERARGGKGGKPRRRGKVTPRVKVETEVLRAAHPPGSAFKGYEPYDVQDLVINARAVHYRRERWRQIGRSKPWSPRPRCHLQRVAARLRPGTRPTGGVHSPRLRAVQA